MNNKFLKRGYGLIAAFVLTILVATPYATQASGELVSKPNAPDTELVTPNGDCQNYACVR